MSEACKQESEYKQDLWALSFEYNYTHKHSRVESEKQPFRLEQFENGKDSVGIWWIILGYM